MSNEVRFVDADGLRFGYLERGAGPLVLCLHGFPDTAHTFSETLEALANRGFRAVAPFLRGYPPSGAPGDGDYSILRLGRDALAWIEALGERKAALVGHDWGALAGYAAARLAPDRIARLAAMAVPHLRAQAARGPLLAQARRSWYIGFFQLPWFPERIVPRHDFAFIDRLWRRWSPNWRYAAAEVAPVKSALREPGAVVAALGYYRALRRLGAPKDRRTLFGQIEVPAVTFAGGEDGCMGIEMFDRQEVAFTGPHRLIRMESAGHFLHREQPELFHRELLGFLGDHDHRW